MRTITFKLESYESEDNINIAKPGSKRTIQLEAGHGAHIIWETYREYFEARNWLKGNEIPFNTIKVLEPTTAPPFNGPVEETSTEQEKEVNIKKEAEKKAQQLKAKRKRKLVKKG